MREQIRQKIEEIRQKPEHIRVRYVWVAVGIVMFFIFIVWMVTLQESFRKSAPEVKNLSKTIKNPVQELKSIESLDSMSEEKIGEEGFFKEK